MAATMKSVKQLKMKSSAAFPVVYDSDSPPLAEIREHLAVYQGGSVDLSLGQDGIATITLNQPNKKNAISGKMMGDFHDVVETLENWNNGKGVIVCGQGENFCSGGDLDLARGTGDANGGFKMATFMNNVLSRLQVLPFISVAVVEGCGALGGGSEISVACDYRLVSSSCRGMGFVHGRMGIVPAWGGTGRLTNIVGYRNALSILSTAKVYSPSELLAIGLVDEVIPPETDALTYARSWLQERMSLSPSIIHALKTTALLYTQQSQNAQELEQRIFAPFWGSPENKAALAANIKHTGKTRDN